MYLHIHSKINGCVNIWLNFIYGFSVSVWPDSVFSLFKRVNNFSTDGSSGFVCKIYLAKKSDRITCLSTFFFQAFFLIFFFDLLVRFC